MSININEVRYFDTLANEIHERCVFLDSKKNLVKDVDEDGNQRLEVGNHYYVVCKSKYAHIRYIGSDCNEVLSRGDYRVHRRIWNNLWSKIPKRYRTWLKEEPDGSHFSSVMKDTPVLTTNRVEDVQYEMNHMQMILPNVKDPDVIALLAKAVNRVRMHGKPVTDGLPEIWKICVEQVDIRTFRSVTPEAIDAVKVSMYRPLKTLLNNNRVKYLHINAFDYVPNSLPMHYFRYRGYSKFMYSEIIAQYSSGTFKRFNLIDKHQNNQTDYQLFDVEDLVLDKNVIQVIHHMHTPYMVDGNICRGSYVNIYRRT